MDTAQLTALAREAVTALAPLIAAGALARIGEETTDATKGLLTRALDLLRQRFAG